jgi:CubicO group peptidase (beta-lactamase class C family)
MCDATVAQSIALQGLNPAYETMQQLSSATIPSLGFATEDMSSAIDPTVGNYMNQWGLPGGAVAISHTDCDTSGNCSNHLIFAKSYGYMDLEAGQFAQPDTRFRLASVSKAMAAMATLKLVHDGALQLGDQPFPLQGLNPLIGSPTMAGTFFMPGTYNTALSAITVREILHHAGGWDRTGGVGPDLTGYSVLQGLETFLSGQAGIPEGAPSCKELMSYVETQPLQFTPGTHTRYSNVGFCAIGEVIAETSGMSYFDYLGANVLQPFGMIDTSEGFTPQSERQDREAIYYDPVDPLQASLFPPYAVVPAPYSTIGAIESQEAAAAVLSTAIDVSRFAAQVASGQPVNLPGGTAYPNWPKDYYLISSAVEPYGSATGDQVFGAGWDTAFCPAISSPGEPLHSYDNCNFFKNGGFPGTMTAIGVTADGYGFAGVFNGGAANSSAPDPGSAIFWVGCENATTQLAGNTMVPAAATGSGNCGLQAAYNHTAVAPWDIDFFPQYSEAYSKWMNATEFSRYLKREADRGRYPSRLEGRPNRSAGAGDRRNEYEFRGRFGTSSGGAAPTYAIGQTCPEITAAINAAPANTPLVSLQRFPSGRIGNSYLYQAVWSQPLPPLAQLTVSASPVLLSVAQGSSGTFAITTTISGSFDSAVTLAASGGGGNTLTFSPSSIAAPGAGISTLTVEANSTGDYSIAITATGGGITNTTTVTLEVTP